jgi:hypothetical protein
VKTFFPEMDKEIADDRLAERREARQLARKTLADNQGMRKWILGRLKENGPSTDLDLSFQLSEILNGSKAVTIALSMMPSVVAFAMWTDGELWRRDFVGHPSGQKCFTYGIRGKHEVPV